MLEKWGLSNFKSFYDETEIELAPLTVLTGTNSSGKSTLIQSMLVIAQTLRNSISSREFVLNGPLVKMGTTEDIRSVNDRDVEINFTSSLLPEEKRQYIKCKLFFALSDKLNNAVFEVHKDNKKTGELIIKRSTNKNSYVSEVIRDKNSDMIIESATGVFMEEMEKYCVNNILQDTKLELFHFFPVRYVLPPNHPNIKKNEEIWMAIVDLELSTLYPFESEEYLALHEAIPPLSFDESLIPTKDLTNYFSGSFKYLGPLRFLDSVHPFSVADDPKDVGISGEYTASVIHSFWDKPVVYMGPGPKELNNKIFDVKTIVNLNDALTFWLNYFSVCEKIEVSQLSKMGYELKVAQTGVNRFIDITQVGVGVSQVLPILVMGLLADSGSTLVFQQPEEQLHPKVQSRLADFFISMSLSGKQCIIETHSEYFIDKLRLRTCQSLLNDDMRIKQNTRIYYLAKDGPRTKITPIEIDENASYTNWPDGFFDERQNNSEEIRNSINRKIMEENDDSGLFDD